MNESWPSEAERGRLTSFPEYIPEVDLIAFFTLASADQQLIRKRSGLINRLGIALQLCALRYMGSIPEDLNLVPASALKFLARQLGIEEVLLNTYGAREQTRTDHRQIIEKHLGYRRAGLDEWGQIEQWLDLRALEHDRPSFLLQLLCEQLQTLNFVRPGWSVLERAVASARQQAHDETWRMVEDQVKGADRDKLDGLLIVPKNERFTPLTRFRTGATSHSAQAILHTLEKISELKTLGIAHWDLSRINPNRMKMLAQKGRKATNQALQRMPPERRYPILLAFLKQTSIDTTAGYTELIFCLFDLLGYQFAPRLRDLGDQTLYRVDPAADFGAVNQLLTGRFHSEWFLDQWDDMLRLAGSLKMGWVTASLLIGKLNAMPKHNTLVRAMQEYGRLIKTNFILRYLCNPEFRRQIHRQLNKGEALHALRRYLTVAQEGQIRKRYPDGPT